MPSQCLAQYEIPKDQRYWSYYNWYTSHSVVSLVVSGTDQNHVYEALNELPKLKKNGAIIGEVVVIGMPKEKKREDYDKLENTMSNLKFNSGSFQNSKYLVDKYNIKFSPTWIVKHRGKEYVYEGLKKPQTLFDSRGVFRDAK